MFDPTDHQNEQALLQQLRASGDPAAQQQAATLQGFYHQREMGGLAADVYDAGKETGEPPSGWIRASEHPELLREYAPQLQMTKAELQEALHPDKSGFRAEIYLPDPKVLGPGYVPVVAFKGSAGEVMTAHGLRDTTQEDFFANNFPQSVGLETDYYDRAMKLAYDLKREGLYFELTGHSLAGGEAAAAAAVTGYLATTWNAAGLHPETAKRFGEQYGVAVLGVGQLGSLITAYQVQGELLTNGVQENIDRMDMIQRAELGGVLKETSELLKALPQGRELLQQQLDKGVPPEAQAAVHAFVDRIATGDTAQMLRDLPLSVGDVQPLLAPMTRVDPDDPASPLVARERVLSLPQITLLAGPVLETMSVAAMAAHAGERGGGAVAMGGLLAQQALHSRGDEWRAATEWGGRASRAVTGFEGALAQTAEHHIGAALADLRETHAEARARIDQELGTAQRLGASLEADLLRGAGAVLPDGAQAWLDARAGELDRAGEAANRRGQAEATEARRAGRADASLIRGATRAVQSGTNYVADRMGDLQHDAIAGVGHLVGGGLDATGRYVESTTRHAPAAGAAVGAMTGMGAASALELSAANYPRLFGAAAGIAQARQAGVEAFERHLMRATVLPSMDSRINDAEQRALQTLQRTAAPEARNPPAVPALLDDPSHPGHAMLLQARDGVHRIDVEMGRSPDQYSENLAGALTVAARAGGLNRIDIVTMSGDGSRAFATQHVVARTLEVHVHVEAMAALGTSLEQNSMAWQKAAEQPVQELLQPANQMQAQAAGPSRSQDQSAQLQTGLGMSLSR